MTRSSSDANSIEEASRAAARSVGLVYTTDDKPGIRRMRHGKGFRYVGSDDKPLTDAETLVRIKSLAIPPAYEEVWIAPSPNAHLQATGRDARGRKQYRYHPKWRQVRDANKYEHMIDFAKALPRIRARTRRHLRRKGLPREKVLATVVQLMEKTLIRVGNEEYARDNNSYGLTTLQDRHASISPRKVGFRFRGKHGKVHEIDVSDPRLAKIVRACQDLPGQELFQYVDDDGEVRDIGSSDVNDYLREITGEDFTAKDFRTWYGTVLAAEALREFETFHSKAQARRNINSAIERVAERLGNTKAVCRKCYVHPDLIDTYMDGNLVKVLEQRAANLARQGNVLAPDEAAVLALLQRRLAERQPGRKVA